MPVFEFRSFIDAPAPVVFQWHQQPDALESLIPPWESVAIEQRPASLHEGQQAILIMKLGPLHLRWIAQHTAFADYGVSGGEFTDFQVSGPFKSWRHRHRIRAEGPLRCVLEDHVEYELPFGPLGRVFGSALTRRKLQRMFEFRHTVTREKVATLILAT